MLLKTMVPSNQKLAKKTIVEKYEALKHLEKGMSNECVTEKYSQEYSFNMGEKQEKVVYLTGEKGHKL